MQAVTIPQHFANFSVVWLSYVLLGALLFVEFFVLKTRQKVRNSTICEKLTTAHVLMKNENISFQTMTNPPYGTTVTFLVIFSIPYTTYGFTYHAAFILSWSRSMQVYIS